MKTAKSKRKMPAEFWDVLSAALFGIYAVCFLMFVMNIEAILNFFGKVV